MAPVCVRRVGAPPECRSSAKCAAAEREAEEDSGVKIPLAMSEQFGQYAGIETNGDRNGRD